MLPLEREQSAERKVSVMTSDGESLGTVAGAGDGYLKINAPMQRDYWLPEHLVQSRDDAQITLGLTKQEVPGYRLPAPPDTADREPDDEFARIAQRVTLSPDEMLEQRARMERELAEQSRALPPHQPSVTELRGPRAYERIPADHTGFGELAGQYVPNAPVHDEYVNGGRRRNVMLVAAGAAAIIAIVVGLALRRARR